MFWQTFVFASVLILAFVHVEFAINPLDKDLGDAFPIMNDLVLEEVDPDKLLMEIMKQENPNLDTNLIDIQLGQDQLSLPQNSIGHDSLLTPEIYNQDTYLHNRGLVRRNVYGDGNCLFRSISFALYNTEERHLELRHLAIENIRNHRALFADYFRDNDMNTELERLNQSGMYAGVECVHSLSLYFRINIIITQGGQPNTRITTLQMDEAGLYSSRAAIQLAFSTSIGGGHYDLVIEDHTGSTFASESNPIHRNEHTPSHTHVADSFEKSQEIKQQTEHTIENVKSDHELYCSKSMPEQTAVTAIRQVNSDHQLYCSESLPEQAPKSRKLNLCTECHMNFATKGNLERHIKNKHQSGNKRVKSNIQCNDPSCPEQFATISNLCEHLSDKHNLVIQKSNFHFQTEEEFLSWKVCEESKKNVFFKCKAINRNKKNKNGKINKLFECNRSGKYTTKSSLKRSKNKKGSCKIGGVCPARMNVVYTEDCISVKYIETHFHSTDLDQAKFLRIPDIVRKRIVSKLSMGVPIQNIVNSFRDKACDLNNRQGTVFRPEHFIDTKDIHNIKSRQIKISADRASDDATSVHLRVLNLQSSPSNPVLLYKQQHVLNNDIPLKKEDFMLVLMTHEQAELFKKFAPSVICVDSTHSTNQYKFYLITVLVVNDHNKGIPVAFCISNKEDESTLQVFFRSIKNKCPNTVVDSLMTDDTHASYNAAKTVFGLGINHYLCVFHFRNNWNKRLDKCGNPERLKQLQTRLGELVRAQNRQHFLLILNEIRNEYGNSYAAFFKYFDQNYANRPEKWALYARKEGLRKSVITNNHVERFHRTIKHSYLHAKHNRRLDTLVDALLEFERNCYIDNVKTALYKHSDFDTSGRHQASCSIPDDNVQKVNEDTFSVLSSDQSQIYNVKFLRHACNIQPCSITCCKKPCHKLCIHLYKCSCSDKKDCCKHVHKVHSMQCLTLNQTEDLITTTGNGSFINNQNESVSETEQTDSGNLRRFFNNMQKLESDVSGPCRSRLAMVNKALESILGDNLAFQNINDKIIQLSPKEKIAPNKKIEKQPQFMQTQRKKVNKKKKSFQSLGSVAPYPPLRLSSSRPMLQRIPTTEPVQTFVNDHGILIPRNLLAPPSLRQFNVTDGNGKKTTIVLSQPVFNDKEDNAFDS